MKKFIILIPLFFIIFNFISPINIVHADALTDNITEQLGKIDLSELKEFIKNNSNNFGDGLIINLEKMIKGEFSLDFNSVFQYILNLFINSSKNSLPILISIFAIAIFCGLVESFKGSFFSNEISSVIFFVGIIGVLLLFSTQIYDLYDKTLYLINSISTFNQIVSPILLSLMIASGGNVSVGVFKPSVFILSGLITQIIVNVVMPLVLLSCIFSVMNEFSDSVRIKRFSNFFNSLIKWIIGLTITVFGLFVTVQGIASATFDGISIKAVKYAISNSIPLIGGFLKDGFDVVVAGSVLIKNAIGASSLIYIFSLLLSPLIEIIVFSLLLKFLSALIEPFANQKLCNVCAEASKSVTYFLVCVLFVFFLFFIVVLLIIFSANYII